MANLQRIFAGGWLFWITIVVVLFDPIQAAVNPIEIQGRQLVDSVTGEPVCSTLLKWFFFLLEHLLTQQFYIKGVDYQPGGSSAYIGRSDPLSDIESCSRDIFLFQRLGVNV
jgi:hypothetical protein